jgi:hypothetical protein
MIVMDKNYNRTDCSHFKWSHVSGCCGRARTMGACKLTEGPEGFKICRTKAEYCKFQRREENNVHLEKLPDPN